MAAGSAAYSAAVFCVSAWTMWVMVSRVVEQTMAITMAIRVRLDDRVGFNIDDLIVTESMLPEEHIEDAVIVVVDIIQR